MRLFLLKCFFAAALVSAIILIFVETYSDQIDPLYSKFTSDAQSSLIIGDSKSFQGIQPSILNNKLAGNFNLPVYNYSFTMKEVVYGDELLESIKLKLKDDTKNGLFILSLSPAVLTERDGDNIAEGIFAESSMPPHNMRFVSMKPNVEYILKNFSSLSFKSVYRENSVTHPDGWMEDKHMAADLATKKSWETQHIDRWNKLAKKWRKSDYRLEKLSETISFLQQHGTVYLVRMPTDSSFTTLENDFWPNFDETISEIAIKQNTHYLNFTSRHGQFETYDGVHLTKADSGTFSAILCDSILKYTNQ